MARGRSGRIIRNVYPPKRFTRRNTARKPKAPQKDVVSIGGNVPAPPSHKEESDNESNSSELESGQQRQEKLPGPRIEDGIGCLRSTPFESIDDEDVYKLVPETADEEDLFQAKNRMEAIVKNKKFLERLPDGGDKLKAMCERVVVAYEKLLTSRAPCFYKTLNTKKAK